MLDAYRPQDLQLWSDLEFAVLISITADDAERESERALPAVVPSERATRTS